MGFFKKEKSKDDINKEITDFLKNMDGKAIYLIDAKGGLHSMLSEDASVTELIGIFHLLERQYSDFLIKTSENKQKTFEAPSYIG